MFPWCILFRYRFALLYCNDWFCLHMSHHSCYEYFQILNIATLVAIFYAIDKVILIDTCFHAAFVMFLFRFNCFDFIFALIIVWFSFCFDNQLVLFIDIAYLYCCNTWAVIITITVCSLVFYNDPSSYYNITETSPYSFGNFRKLSLYNCFYAHLTY